MQQPWKPFFQTEKLTTRIHNILREYPPGLGTFKEFLQNADDAKASNFIILYDTTTHKGNDLLCSSMKEWQGPSLYLYNSSTFTEKDFEGITQVGNSGKVSDPTTIGKYGLGFNCSYHFSDLVSFMSKDQLIYFDPHGKYLPDHVLGIRCTFTEFNDKYNDILSTYKFKEFNSCDVSNKPINGTIFRLPLRNKIQSENSLLSNCYYSNNELNDLLYQFSKEAGEMILFLNYIQDIKVLCKDEFGIKEISHINITNISNSITSKRINRNFPTKHENKYFDNINQYNLDISTKLYNKDIQITNWIISSISKKKELTSIEKLIDSSAIYQWVNVATCLNNKISSGRVYCSLPLPMQTGYPVHINGNFALSSNRRHLWINSNEEQSAPANFKSNWNRELTLLLVSAYFNLLITIRDKLSNPNDLYNYWPCSNNSHYFQEYLLPNFVSSLSDNKRNIFWDSTKKRWLPLSKVIFPDKLLPKTDPFYSILHSLQLVTVFPPDSIIYLLTSHGHLIQILSQHSLIQILKDLPHSRITSSHIADEILAYLLYDIHQLSDNLFRNRINNLQGMKLLPLINNKIGTFLHSSNSTLTTTYLLCKSNDKMNILPSCDQFIDNNSKSFKLLKNKKITQISNVKLFEPNIIHKFMHYIIPKTWKNVASVYVSGNLTKEQVFNISESHIKSKKRNKKQIPKGLITARDTSISIDILKNRLNLFWKFMEDNLHGKTFPLNLSCWPLVYLESENGDMISTIDVCKKGSLSYNSIIKYKEEGVNILKHCGCFFYIHECNLLNRLIGVHRIETVNTIISYLRKHNSININSLMLRKIVLDWISEPNIDITSSHIAALPLFINISRSKGLCLESKNSILPPKEWYKICKIHFPEITIDINDTENNNLILIYNTHKQITIKQFLANCICDKLDMLPQDVCIKFLQTIGSMKDSESPWFAAQNKENRIIINALETRNIIVFNDGHRCKITDIMDCSDNILSEIMGSSSSNYSYAPDIYREDPAIRKIFRKLPVKSLVDFDVFYNIAKITATEKDIILGISLIKFIAKSYQLIKWSTSQCNRLKTIEFIPCWNLKEYKYITSPMDIKIKPNNLCCITDGFLVKDLLSGWTQGYIFCNEVSDIPAKFQTRLGFQRTIPLANILLHIHELQKKSFNNGNMVPIEYRESYQIFLTNSCKRLDTVIKKNAKQNSVSIKHSLSSCKFIMLHSGELVYPYQLCFDLDEDLGPFARAVPEYLRNYHKLFSAIGTPMITKAHAPQVIEINNKPDISQILVNARNDPTFSDLIFTHNETKYYSHKLVIAVSCPVIYTMLTSEINNQKNTQIEYPLPDWVNWKSFNIMMDYCYTGNVCFTNNYSYNNEDDINNIAELLRLADLYLMNHLKSWCEVFLSKVNIDVFNVCNLLEIAEMCNANQLLNYCIFTIRIMFTTIQQTQEWKDLPEIIKTKVLAGSLFEHE